MTLSLILFLFCLNLCHLVIIILNIFFYSETIDLIVKILVLVVIPVKDTAIALLLVRLYYYQATRVNNKESESCVNI